MAESVIIEAAAMEAAKRLGYNTERSATAGCFGTRKHCDVLGILPTGYGKSNEESANGHPNCCLIRKDSN